MHLKTALFCRDAKQVEEVMKVLEGEMKMVKSDELGIQSDYSFHHRYDRVNNTLTYGLQFIKVFAEWASMTVNTRFRFSEETMVMAVNYYLDGICKQMVYGRTPDIGIRNRDITRLDHVEKLNLEIPERLMQVTV